MPIKFPNLRSISTRFFHEPAPETNRHPIKFCASIDESSPKKSTRRTKDRDRGKERKDPTNNRARKKEERKRMEGGWVFNERVHHLVGPSITRRRKGGYGAREERVQGSDVDPQFVLVTFENVAGLLEARETSERGSLHPVYNLVTSTIYYERAYLTGEASSVSINSSSQDINVLYIVHARATVSRGVKGRGRGS